MRQFQCAPTTYVTEIKETYFEIYTEQVSCPLALPLLNISNCQSVLFAKLVLAWLQQSCADTLFFVINVYILPWNCGSV